MVRVGVQASIAPELLQDFTREVELVRLPGQPEGGAINIKPGWTQGSGHYNAGERKGSATFENDRVTEESRVVA
jgi:hypothetical protein